MAGARCFARIANKPINSKVRRPYSARPNAQIFCDSNRPLHSRLASAFGGGVWVFWTIKNMINRFPESTKFRAAGTCYVREPFRGYGIRTLTDPEFSRARRQDTIEVLLPSRPRRALRRNCLRLDLWRDASSWILTKNFSSRFFTATHNRHLLGSSSHRERKRHPLDLRSVFCFPRCRLPNTRRGSSLGLADTDVLHGSSFIVNG